MQVRELCGLIFDYLLCFTTPLFKCPFRIIIPALCWEINSGITQNWHHFSSLPLFSCYGLNFCVLRVLVEVPAANVMILGGVVMPRECKMLQTLWEIVWQFLIKLKIFVIQKLQSWAFIPDKWKLYSHKKSIYGFS